MKGNTRYYFGRHKCNLLLSVFLAISYAFIFEQVLALSGETSSNQWPVFPRRNLASLAREGYLKGIGTSDKRSISTLAKNGQLPTFKSPDDDAVKDDNEDDVPGEKRNMASIARLRSYTALKRNVQALARDGHRFGRGQYSQPNDKRNIAALARNGYIHKRSDLLGDEYYYPFYQNSVPPLSEIDGPLDINEMYDFEQSVNPDMFPPLSQVFKRSDTGEVPDISNARIDYDNYWNLKRGSVGLPAHGLYRPAYIDINGNLRNKRSIYSIPDVLDQNDIDIPDYDNQNDDKRSVGSIPLTRISGLGNISLIPKLTHPSIQTTPTYRRRQYLLTRTRQGGTSTDR